MILCDIGNTTFHFLIDGKHKKYFLDEKIPKFKDDIFYISVNEKATKKLLKVNKKAKDLSSFIKFDTDYLGMGLDRKVACTFCENSIIVDAGSAITVDIIENSTHKGGFILLGVHSFFKSYEKISKKLKVEKTDFEKNINLDKIPLQTKDAILYALMKSIILPIKEVSFNKNIIFTGGDGEFLCQFFENSQYKKDLIFENMKRIIDANNCIA
ncbi:pantothenate kinase, type III [Aliarcobacter faecis]|uniref:type III pantothenate kinase n=1 Tax=Aliarcobacter faecis TaxID=1564138 RepID=UPI00047B3DE1|nr:type III pantothenate kinase [Aliarcobacter faecis]QKF74059.1 pantothenate kinase, type III [Aliarcobacter faecis]